MTHDMLLILGKNLASPEAVEVLKRYPALEPETQDLAPEEGLAPVHYLRSESDGLLIKVSDEGEILTILLMSEGKDGFSQFAGPLPGRLGFASTRPEVLKALGAPAFIRPAGKLGSFEHGELMRFDKPHGSVHIQFRSRGAGIELVTMMVPQLVPGRSVSSTEEEE
jgi:hypothetical protein